MFYYSKNSKMKVFHTGKCRHFYRIKEDNISIFADAFEGRKYGYTYCSHCCPMKAKYEREQHDIINFSEDNQFDVKYKNGELIIRTPFSKWKLICVGEQNRLALYHRNTQGRKATEYVPGYHEQKFRAGTIIKMMCYILSHDNYRRTHPLESKPTSKNNALSNYYKRQKHRSNKNKRAANLNRSRYNETIDFQLAIEDLYDSEYANLRIG